MSDDFDSDDEQPEMYFDDDEVSETCRPLAITFRYDPKLKRPDIINHLEQIVAQVLEEDQIFDHRIVSKASYYITEAAILILNDKTKTFGAFDDVLKKDQNLHYYLSARSIKRISLTIRRYFGSFYQ